MEGIKINLFGSYGLVAIMILGGIYLISKDMSGEILAFLGTIGAVCLIAVDIGVKIHKSTMDDYIVKRKM